MTVKLDRAYLFVNKGYPNKVLYYDDAVNIFTLKNLTWHVLQSQAVVIKRYLGRRFFLHLNSKCLAAPGLVLQALPITPVPATDDAHWYVSAENDDGYRKIYNDRSPKLYLAAASSPPKVFARPKSPSETDDEDCLWKLILLPTLSELEQDEDSESESESESDGDSDIDWEDIARYIFKEGLKMMRTAASSEWWDMDEETRNEYVRLWKKMGRKKGVYD